MKKLIVVISALLIVACAVCLLDVMYKRKKESLWNIYIDGIWKI